MPSLMIDIRRLRQILINLLGNAVKFTKDGFITVEATYDGNLTFKVSDTGIGIEAEFLKKIFNPFEQQSRIVRNQDEFGGTGLGLAISQKLAEKMGGTIEVESVLGEGSCFTLSLSDIDVSAVENLPVSHFENISTVIEKANVHHSLDVLIVDDVIMNLKVLSTMLKKLEVRHTMTTSPLEAIKIIKSNRPKILLTDLWMPDMSGVELANKVREDVENFNMKIIAVTADSQVMDSDHVFDDVLIKPITLDSVRKVLERFAAKKEDLKN